MTDKFIHFPEMLGTREFFVRDDLVKKITVLPDDMKENGQNIHCYDGAYFTILKHSKYILGQIAKISQPKYERVDLFEIPDNLTEHEYPGYARAIDDIKSKYGDLYVEVKTNDVG